MIPPYLYGQDLSTHMQSLELLILLINAVVHVLFAGAVARDAGLLRKRGIPTYLVSSMTWAFATLVGGVFVGAIYWFMHHVNVLRDSRH